jgi:alpha-amylase
MLDFKYASLFDQFANAPQIASLKALLSSGATWLPSAQAVVFTTNHDTERDSPPRAVMYQDGKAYDLATVFLLAWPYGGRGDQILLTSAMKSSSPRHRDGSGARRIGDVSG